jgi:hypothetical protein
MWRSTIWDQFYSHCRLKSPRPRVRTNAARIKADDTQICGICQPGDVPVFSNIALFHVLLTSLPGYEATGCSLKSTRLACSGAPCHVGCLRCRLHASISLGGYDVAVTSSSVRNLGVHLDLNLRRLVTLTPSCHAALHSIRQYVTVSSCDPVACDVVGPVRGCMDYCNSILWKIYTHCSDSSATVDSKRCRSTG